MRRLLLALALISTPALAASDILMHRDPGCGCCEEWAARVRQAFGRDMRIVDDANRAAFQRRVGLPEALASCHTAVVDGLAFEGHVPIADMRRVLASRPRGVRGLAVAGMPLGSPGMEVPGGRTQPYAVMAFGTERPSVFARH
ncbi:DUF411 domain-containing protein [Novosphingobium cyanobacteriorum]|uniref:DUF411 domain-containing protein n=1 Tax=Novosphingobium cyanobacteriorum TaxID=3024215 RepID=A0ABT6CNJ0_9SPHN|nr:DUF411 domain-containing protein [Novosphingobium cyanobacteriorum]MDF8335474.1 DUF411 domain-containing protein [Novosphingobium cyanobacteriorum]